MLKKIPPSGQNPALTPQTARDSSDENTRQKLGRIAGKKGDIDNARQCFSGDGRLVATIEMTWPEPDFAFTAKEREALYSLPIPDLLAILNKADDAASIPFLEDIYSDLPEEEKNKYPSYPFFLKQLQNKPHNMIINYVEKFLRERGNRIPYIQKILLVISSGEFKKISGFLVKGLRPQKDDLIYYQVFKLMRYREPKYIIAVKSKEFTDFCARINRDYAINPCEDIVSALVVFTSSKDRERFESVNAKTVLSLLKKYFPQFDFKDARDISFLKNIFSATCSGDAEKIIDGKMKAYETINKHYGIKINNKHDLVAFLSVPNDNLAILNTVQAKNSWDYIKKNYPQKTEDIKTDYILNDFAKLVKNLNNLKIDIKELDEFLKIFSIKLDDIDNSTNLQKLGAAGIKTAVNSSGFHAYIQKTFTEYPFLKENLLKKSFTEQLDDIIFITLQYKNYNAFYKTLDFCKKSAGSGELIPNNLDIMAVLLEKFPKISWDCDKPIDTEVIRIVKEKLKNGRAEEFYNKLRDVWGIQITKASHFLFLLAENKENFYLDNNNIKKFEQLKEKYTIEDNDIKYLSIIQIIFKNLDFFCNDKLINFICTFFPEKMAARGDKKFVKLMDLAGFYRCKILLAEGFPEILKTDYGFEKNDVCDLLGQIPEEYENFLKDLKDKKTKDAYGALRQFYRESRLDNTSLLLGAVKIKDIPGYMEALEKLKIYRDKKELDFDFDINSDFVFYVLSDASVVNNLKNPNFLVFYKEIKNHFKNDIGSKNELLNDIHKISIVSRLYDEIKNNPENRKFLFSNDYKDVMQYIKSKFILIKMEISSLLPILKIARNFNREKLDRAIEKLESAGERITISDISPLVEVMQDQKLKEYLDSKEKMIMELQEALKTSPMPRDHLDEAGILEMGKNYSNKSDIDKKITGIKKSYSERPTLEELKKWPTLKLLRALLLLEALKNKNFLKSIGNMLVKDTENTSAEAGGEIIVSGGALALNEVPSTRNDDGSYSRLPSDDLNFTTFHCHSVKGIDIKVYTGPSGFLNTDGGGGDAGYAASSGITDVLFSNLGHPKDADGKIRKDQLVVNIDLYFAIDGKLYIFDMGVKTIDLP